MNASKIIGSVLIILSLFLGYLGFNKIADNTNEINLLGIKIDASNESGKTKGILYLGLAVIVFAGGIYIVGKKQ